MKTIVSAVLIMLTLGYAFAQDSTMQNMDSISLKQPKFTGANGSAPGQGNEGWGNESWKNSTDTATKIKYCMDFTLGRLVLEKNNTPVNTTVKLKNGSTVNPEGLVKRKNGAKVQLKNGDCVFSDGIIGN